MTDCFDVKDFTRHGRRLRAVQLGHQAWFCLADIARLMGKPLNERSIQKLDPDQHREAWLACHEHWSKQLLISESGLYAMLIYHPVPENRALRQWVTHEVLPVLREHPLRDTPCLSALRWARSPVGLMQWRSEYWVRLKDVPEMAVEVRARGLWGRLKGLWSRGSSGSMEA